MAESIIIHFREIDENELITCLDQHFDRHSEESWYHPKNDYLVIITIYTHYSTEYEDEDRTSLQDKLGGDPTISYDFEIRRSRSDEACDLLEPFIRNELKGFNFVVDDMFNLYSKSELESVSDFLDMYRYKKIAEQGHSL